MSVLVELRKVLQQVTRCIFSPAETGYTSKDDDHAGNHFQVNRILGDAK